MHSHGTPQQLHLSAQLQGIQQGGRFAGKTSMWTSGWRNNFADQSGLISTREISDR